MNTPGLFLRYSHWPHSQCKILVFSQSPKKYAQLFVWCYFTSSWFCGSPWTCFSHSLFCGCFSLNWDRTVTVKNIKNDFCYYNLIKLRKSTTTWWICQPHFSPNCGVLPMKKFSIWPGASFPNNLEKALYSVLLDINFTFFHK